MIIYGTEQIADMFQLTEQQARKLMKVPDFPSFRIGRAYKVSEDDLKDWIRTRPQIRFSRRDED